VKLNNQGATSVSAAKELIAEMSFKYKPPMILGMLKDVHDKSTYF